MVRHLIGCSGAAAMILGGMALPFIPPISPHAWVWWRLAGGVILVGFLLYAWGVLSEPREKE